MKRMISLMCIIVMLFSLCLYPANAQNLGDIGVTFNADQKIVTAGYTVDYKLSIDLNEYISIGGLGFKLNFPGSAFYIESVTLASAFSGADVSVNTDLGIVSFAWESGNAVQTATDVMTVKLTAYSEAYLTTYTPVISSLEIYDDTIEMNNISAWTEDIGSIEVTDAKVLTGIALHTEPTKKTYTVGSELDIAGLSITLYYSDNSTETMSDGFIPLYDFSTEGTKDVVIFYDGFRTSPFTVTVTGAPPLPTSISSSVYSVSAGYIGKIAAGTTVGNFMNGFNEKNYLEAYQSNVKASDTEKVKTGMTLKLTTNGKEMTVIVTGDVSGDGEISITDMVLVKSYLLGKSSFTAINEKAADTNGDKTVSITDFIQLKAFLLGKEQIIPRSAD